MTIMNKAQADEVFEREAILLGSSDQVPDFRAAALFGQDAVDHAHRIQSACGGYGIGDFTLCALTRTGFRAAASFYNVKQLRKEAEEKEE